MATSFHIETQEKLNWCWAAVAATVARYFSPQSQVKQCAIAKEVLQPENGDCCSAEACDQGAELQTALSAVNKLIKKTLNNKTLNRAVLDFEQIRQQIDNGRPVCARIQWNDDNAGHFVMISGYSISQSGEEWLDISDPYYEDSTVTYDHLVNAYLDAGTWTDTYLVGQV